MRRRQRGCRVRLNSHRVWATLDRLNMTQNELARLVGTSSSYLSQLMSGHRRPSAAFRKKLMDVLGVTEFDDLFILEEVA
ncbi:MAG: helix-turn-helix transcriptional regulator [Chloroflexota bacterium]|nr:helix-turn-helix transcriptional regulator [Chloroflexota bacterium]